MQEVTAIALVRNGGRQLKYKNNMQLVYITTRSVRNSPVPYSCQILYTDFFDSIRFTLEYKTFPDILD